MGQASGSGRRARPVARRPFSSRCFLQTCDRKLEDEGSHYPTPGKHRPHVPGQAVLPVPCPGPAQVLLSLVFKASEEFWVRWTVQERHLLQGSGC